jgi:hypothetical protein
MRDLIKTILKEEETDKHKNGIDVAIKLLKRFYPFVINWQYSENYESFEYGFIDIDVICDIQKTLDFYNTDLDPPKDIIYLTKDKTIRKINVDMFRFQ